MAVQLSDVEYWPGKQQYVKSARLWFVVDELKPLTSAVYTLTYDRQAVPRVASDLKVQSSADHIEITTGKVGVRLPAGGQTFAAPAPMKDVPGPLTSLRLGSGSWAGGSSLTGNVGVAAWSSKLTDADPVLARVALQYTFADKTVLSVSASVVAGDSAVRWDVQVSDDRPALGVAFRLPPVPGVKEVVLPRGYGQWARAAAPTGQRILPLASGEKPFCFLVPDSSLPNTFPENAVHVVLAAGGGGSQVQLHTHEPGRWVEPVAPFTYGGFKSWHADMIGKSWDNWRRLRLPVSYAADGTVTVQASLTKGRRVWSVSEGDPIVGRKLDSIKDQVLDWPVDSKRSHPGLFMDAAGVKAAWARAATDPELMKLLTAPEQRWAWGDIGARRPSGCPRSRPNSRLRRRRTKPSDSCASNSPTWETST